MSKHYLLQKQNGKLIKTTVKDWARENQEKFPKFSFEKPYTTVTTPTSEEIDAQLQREGCIREIFNGDYYCYNPKVINGNDLVGSKYMNEGITEVVNGKLNSIKNLRLAQLKNDFKDLKKYQMNIEKSSKKNVDKIVSKKEAIHPWLENYPIDSKSKYLIIGTHPPMPYVGSLWYYYGNMKEFWRLLDEVYPDTNLFNNGSPKMSAILNFQNEKSISITDMVYKTHVEKFSTDDKMGKICDFDFNPFLKEWLENSSVETIYFTSLGGSNSAKNLFKRWLKINYGIIEGITQSHVNEIVIQRNRKIKLIDLFSPSPNARRSKNKIKEFIEWSNQNSSNDYDKFRIDWYKQFLPK